MKASVVLEKSSNYEIIPLAEQETTKKIDGRKSLLILNKVTETGAPFIVVVGYFLAEKEKFQQESMLAEIETAPTEDYKVLKELIRKRMKDARTPITFW